MRYFTGCCLFFAGLLLPGLVIAEEVPKSPLPAPPENTHWVLCFQEDFDGKTLDPKKWELMECPRRDHRWSKADATLDGNGFLKLRTGKTPEGYSSGAIRSRGRFSQAFGYWEVRCKFPTQEGHWPAFWLFPDKGVGAIGNGGRDGAEIDIMEKPSREEEIQHALHWDGYGKAHRSVAETIRRKGLNEGFHTFALLWTSESYTFYVDGEATWRTAAGGISTAPAYIKLSEEIGDWGGDIAKAELPDYFVVDYVRVYKATAK